MAQEIRVTSKKYEVRFDFEMVVFVFLFSFFLDAVRYLWMDEDVVMIIELLQSKFHMINFIII